jgi:PAS domain S-box-containing protein
MVRVHAVHERVGLSLAEGPALGLYLRAMDAATSGITISDCRLPDMPLIYANNAFLAMTGYRRDEVQGINCRFLQGHDLHQPALLPLRRALREGSDRVVLLRNYRKDGTLFWNELTIAPVRDATGALTHFIGIQTDVTARVAAEEALARSHAELEARVAARTADLEAANAALRRAQEETIDRLARAGEFRDDDTGLHTRRVGRTAALLARELGLPTAEALRVGQAAVLHDVGKVGIPDAILLKPGRLTDEELAHVRQHTAHGAAILGGSEHDLLQLAEVIAVSHHERWDGTGYPTGLAGEAIPLVGRIVAVADVLDALTHARPYKAAWPLERALAEIEAQAGRQFDPRVVVALLRLHEHGHLGL